MPLSRLVLPSGRPLDLVQVRMSSTYAGQLEGYPCKFLNDMQVRAVRAEAEGTSPTTPVHLVEPSRRYPDQPAGPFGPVEVMPAVACVGTFRSTPLAPDLDPALHRSALTVAWFQPHPRVPSAEDADPSLLGIAWEELAQDYQL
ncbi:hypothetical protein [Streptomyces albidoflavus]|uniref:hypothetical protein n=1 Tax=Streptomyces albidoflavus TaxID=1886 RepID=UPI0004BEF4E4|nr:hypothetical protein [Streptomyces albidoflavus]RZE49571.1 hypothetical protein C0Q95_02105 [Streptomyces albidoflavus]